MQTVFQNDLGLNDTITEQQCNRKWRISRHMQEMVFKHCEWNGESRQWHGGCCQWHILWEDPL